MPRFFLCWLLLCSGAAFGSAPVAPSPVILVNAHAEVGIAPAHGLILGFGLPGRANLLWVNPHPFSTARHAGWINYGGDKLWWGPQVDWQAVKGRRFPPDEALDGSWTVTAQGLDHLTMRSAVSPWVGIRAEREITLAPDHPGLVIRNRFTREKPGTQRLQLWTICQLPPPRWCWLDSQPAPGEAPYVNLRPTLDPIPFARWEPELGCVRFAPSPAALYMVGTRGAWIAAVYDELILVHRVEPYPDGDYAEQVSLQLFSGPHYVEVETLGGLATPAVDETMVNTVRWRILERPAALSETELGHWLRAQLTAAPTSP
jgi:hypothetical protein